MDKITIIPGNVRGYGDVVSPKTLEDFMVYDSELSFEDGLYTLVYDGSGVSVGLSVSSGTISVGESVVLTAEVLSGGEPVSGETVSFYDGNTLLGTDETDSDGLATYTASSLGVGSHSLTAEALDKSSSAVTVTVNKLTSTITLSVPSTGTVGTSYTVSGTLVPTTGSVKLYENSVLKDTLTVSSGSFSKAITQSNEGTYSYYAVFEGSSTYSSVTSSTGSIVVSDVPPVPVVTSVSLTADKSILSYADSESATLSATVLDDNDDPMEGETVEFFKGSTSLGTATTNSSGIATKSYASAGSGDVTFTASVGTISSETYSIEDCTYYHESAFTSVQDNFNVSLPSAFEVSFKVRRTSSSGNSSYLEVGGNTGNTALFGQIGGSGNSVLRLYNSEGSSSYSDTSVGTNSSGVDTSYKWIKNGSSNTASMNDTTKTVSNSLTHSKIRKLSITNNRIFELKVKPL
jgi:hypothetical protein